MHPELLHRNGAWRDLMQERQRDFLPSNSYFIDLMKGILLEEFICILSEQVLAFWCRFFLESIAELFFFPSFS